MLSQLTVVNRYSEFRKLWTGDLVSSLGTAVSGIALPLVGAISLHATPLEMGVLAAVGKVPDLVLGLPAGVVVDRLPKRPLLIFSDIGRAVALATIPLAALVHVLGMQQLYAVAVIVGTLNLLATVAETTLVPSLLSR